MLTSARVPDMLVPLPMERALVVTAATGHGGLGGDVVGPGHLAGDGEVVGALKRAEIEIGNAGSDAGVEIQGADVEAQRTPRLLALRSVPAEGDGTADPGGAAGGVGDSRGESGRA